MKAVMNSVISLTMVFSLAVAEMHHEVPIKGKSPSKSVQLQHDHPISSGTACVCAPPIYVVMTSVS
jgi:hypothetical protein